MKNANPTDAKTVAFYFLDSTTDGRYTQAIIAKTVNQAKNLLKVGYTVSEICETIDYVARRGVKMHSFGYLNLCIQDTLREINKTKLSEQAAREMQKLADLEKEKQGEVNVDVESSERNREKARRIGLQSRVGKKYNFDMFEGQ